MTTAGKQNLLVIVCILVSLFCIGMVKRYTRTVDELALAMSAIETTNQHVTILQNTIVEQERRIDSLYANLQKQIKTQNKATRERLASLDSNSTANELAGLLDEYRLERERD